MARMTAEQALGFLRSFFDRDPKGAFKIIRARLKESRPTVRRVRPRNKRKGEICPVCGGTKRRYLVVHTPHSSKVKTGIWYHCFNCVSKGKLSPVA